MTKSINQFQNLLLLFMMTLIPVLSLAQNNVVISEQVRITSDNRIPFVEPHLAINPNDPINMVVGTMGATGDQQGISLYVFVSEDGGQTWQPSEDFNGENIKGADPWLAFNKQGNLFFTYLSEGNAWLRQSTDGGQTWNNQKAWPKADGGSFDYVKMSIDRTGGLRNGMIYLWALQNKRLKSGMRVSPASLITSPDNGDTLIHKKMILPGNLSYQVGDMAILSDGTTLLSFHEIDHLSDFVQYPRLWIVRTEDGGKTFSIPFLVDQNYVADSPDLAVDRTNSSSMDKTYISWMEMTDRKEDITYWNNYLSYSTDKGETWSKPVVPNDVLLKAKHATHHPRIAVNKDGFVGLSWKDPRNADLSEQDCFDLYFSYSTDGGETFSDDIRITEKTTCANVPGNRINYRDNLSIYKRYGDGGDYHGLSALPDGTFQVVWADSRSNTYQLYTTNIAIRKALNVKDR